MRGLKVFSRPLHKKFFHCSACRLLRKFPGNKVNDRAAVDLAYVTYEQETVQESVEKPHPLILLHGMMGSKANWHTLANTFVKSGRQIVSVDSRNHGESVHTETMTYYNMRDDLLLVLDHLNIDKAVLLGHSMGGKTAMVTALTYPERVAGLIVEDVAPANSPRGPTPPAFLQTMLKISLQLREAGDVISMSAARNIAISTLEETIDTQLVREFLAANLVQSRKGYKWRLNLDAVINNFHYLSGFPDFIDEMYDGPTVFIGGKNSPYICKDVFPEIMRLFSNVNVEVIPDAGHWVHFEQPSLFVDCVNRYFSQTEL